jgi:hypothetical protein
MKIREPPIQKTKNAMHVNETWLGDERRLPE